MPKQRGPLVRSPLYLIDAYGFSEWNVWALHEGALSEWCPTCQGRGYTVERICTWRDRNDEFLVQYNAYACPGVLTGCDNARWPCRRRCRSCHGERLRPGDVVRAEDFGDRESLRAARSMFPGLVFESEKRSDMAARAM